MGVCSAGYLCDEDILGNFPVIFVHLKICKDRAFIDVLGLDIVDLLP